MTGLVMIYFGDCDNLPCKSGHNQLTNSKFTSPITKISKSSQWYGGQFRLIYARLARGNNLPSSFGVGSWKRLEGYPGDVPTMKTYGT